MANAEQLQILRQGVSVWNFWRKKHPHAVIDLSGTHLGGAILWRANLREADLSRAHLRQADLDGANLSEVHLSAADRRTAGGRERTPVVPTPYSTAATVTRLRQLMHNPAPIVKEAWQAPRPADRSRRLDGHRLHLSPQTMAAFQHSPAFGLDVTTTLYRHQVEAIEAIVAGHHVMVATSTASGKSLCYLVPIVDRLLHDPHATALLVFPAKAVLQDQLDKVLQLSDPPLAFQEGTFHYDLHLGTATIGVGLYSGETHDGQQQQAIREKARLLFTTPDALHAKILPFLRPTRKTAFTSFDRFFQHLWAVVLDEVHSYRGVFGAHVAFLVRRLRLLCQHLHNTHAQFILASATIANPAEHSRHLTGLAMQIIDQDGAEAYRKDFVLVNPSTRTRAAARQDPHSAALAILEQVLYAQHQTPSTLVFVRSVRGAEQFSATFARVSARQHLPTQERVAVYHGILADSDRRTRQVEIKARRVLCVATTNALELGIDIGDLACAILVGFPGTVASTLQQAGRVGRHGDGTAILILSENPLEQHFARNPAFFFAKLQQPEPVRMPLHNRHIVKTHLLCYLAESRYPLEQHGAIAHLPNDVEAFFGPQAMDLYQELLEERQVQEPAVLQRLSLWHPRIEEEYPRLYSSLRVAVGTARFTLQSTTRPWEEAAGVVDETRAGLLFHHGALCLLNGWWYRSEGLDYPTRRIRLTALQDEPASETFAVPAYTVAFTDQDQRVTTLPHGWFTTVYGPLQVERRVDRYVLRARQKRGKQQGVMHAVDDVHPLRFDTLGLAVVLTAAGERELRYRWHGRTGLDFHATVHGAEHALATLLPLQARCDGHDIAAVSAGRHAACQHQSALILFDAHEGGLGLVAEAHEHLRDLVEEAWAFVHSCPCLDGCPDCVHVPRCERQNAQLNKASTLVFLAMLTEDLGGA